MIIKFETLKTYLRKDSLKKSSIPSKDVLLILNVENEDVQLLSLLEKRFLARIDNMWS